MACDSTTLPTIDFAPLLSEGDEDGNKRVVQEIRKACSEWGFFQIINHGIPVELLKQALELYRAFFEYPFEEKRKYIPNPSLDLPAGYFRSPDLSKEGNEQFSILPPHLGLNVYPKNLPEFQHVFEETYPYLVKLASITENKINQSLGLPPNFLSEYNEDRTRDFLLGIHYFPATETENIGKSAHEDINCITFLYQDDVGGLEVYKNGQWIQVPPTEGALIFNLGDVIRVLSNDRFKSATHRVIRTKGKHRFSFAFSYDPKGDTWVEPLPQFSKEVGELPKYRGFMYKEYTQLRRRDRIHPPKRPEDLTRITHFSITS